MDNLEVFYDQDGIIVRRSENWDVTDLSQIMRDSDVAEIYASHHHTPAEALRISMASSMISLTIEDKGKIVGMFGICPEYLLGKRATIWFLGSDRLHKIEKRFLRNSRMFIDFFLSHYPYLENYTHTENKKAIKWLKFLGADMQQAKPYGIEGELFHYFSFERKS